MRSKTRIFRKNLIYRIKKQKCLCSKYKYDSFVIVDDFSRFTWVLFLKHKYDSFETFKNFCKQVQNEKETNIISVRSDHGGEFENSSF